jgi:Transmembrane secretion effector
VEIAPRDQLGNANALYGLASSSTRIAGPALGGLLVALAGPGVVVAADAASYAASVLALSLLHLPPENAQGARARKPTLWRDMAEGWAEFRSRTLFPAYGIGVIGYAIDGPLAAAIGPAAVFGVGAVYGRPC